MRRLVTLIAVLVVFQGSSLPAIAQEASPGASPVSGCAETTEQENEAIVMRWYTDVLNGQNLDVIDEIVADDHGHHTSLFQDSRLREDTKASIGAVFTAFPDVTMTVDDIISVDDGMVVRWAGSGTFDAPLQGVPPTGEAQTFTGINIFRFECGLIVESWSEVDRLAMLGQDGASGDEPATPEA